MKILFVCQQYIHAARWINQLKDSHHEIFVFDCQDAKIHEDLKWTNYITNWSKRKLPYIKGEERLSKKFPKIYEKTAHILKVTPSEKLEEIIQGIRPDLVHSLEMQSQTYHLLKSHKKLRFKWAYFSWGSDLYLFKDNKNHSKKINKVLNGLNYFFSDNERDISIANQLGLKTNHHFVYPGGGGYEISAYQKYYQPKEKRNVILIKGYHHWAGRALIVMNALEKIVDEINEYKIYVYSAHQIVIDKIEELNSKYNLKIQYHSRHEEIAHEKILELFGKAKIAIGNSISDGIPNTLLEAIISGAFPIQSNPGGASEDYIKHGENGLLIEDPEDENAITELISSALKNDKLLEKASEKNKEIAKNLEREKVKEKVLETYAQIEKDL